MKWLTKREAAAEARVSEKTIDRALKRGLLERAQNNVRKVVISSASLARWMAGGKAQGAA